MKNTGFFKEISAVTVRSLIAQSVFVLVLLFLLYFMVHNASQNMDNRGIDFGFEFLGQQSSFDIQFSLIDYDGSHSYAKAFAVGLLNTGLVSVLAIFFAIVLGVIIGSCKLSSHWLLRNLAGLYVDLFKNIPLFLLVFFLYFAALRTLPLPEDSEGFFGSYLTIKGWYVPCLVMVSTAKTFLFFFLASSMFVFLFFNIKRTWEINKLKVYLTVVVAIITLVIAWINLVGDISLVYPELKQLAATSFTFEGGLRIPPELLSMFLSLSVYTSCYVAGTVVSCVESVGRLEIKKVLPELANQCVNVIKNSTLSAAIAYPDLVLVFAGTAMMQTGRAIEKIGMTASVYLLISLLLSRIINIFPHANKELDGSK